MRGRGVALYVLCLTVPVRSLVSTLIQSDTVWRAAAASMLKTHRICMDKWWRRPCNRRPRQCHCPSYRFSVVLWWRWRHDARERQQNRSEAPHPPVPCDGIGGTSSPSAYCLLLLKAIAQFKASPYGSRTIKCTNVCMPCSLMFCVVAPPPSITSCQGSILLSVEMMRA